MWKTNQNFSANEPVKIFDIIIQDECAPFDNFPVKIKDHSVMGGDSHIKHTGMLIRNFEFNP